MSSVKKEVINRACVETICEFKPKKTKTREKVLIRKTKAKSFRTWMQPSITLLERDYKHSMERKMFTPEEVLGMMRTILDKHDEFMERDKVVLEMWKGKSGLKIIEKPDCFMITRHQKKEKDGVPEKIVSEVDKTEVNEIIHSINVLNRSMENKGIESAERWVPTRDLAEFTYKIDWDAHIFSDRSLHHKVTYILNILEYYKMIVYSRGGKSRIVNPAENVEEVLANYKKMNLEEEVKE